MARKYVRDNRGRFASVGATARGAALRTPSGRKRASVRMTAPKAAQAGTTAKPKGLRPGAITAKAATRAAARPGKAPARAGSPATSRLRPGEVMNAVARPVNTMGRFRPDRGHGYKDAPASLGVGSPERKAVVLGNVRQAGLEVKRRGGKIQAVVSRPQDKATAWYTEGARAVTINASSPYWVKPVGWQRRDRREGFTSTLSPRHAAVHEMGHVVHHRTARRIADRPAPRLASRVSGYANYDEAEFVAETYAGLRLGQKYDHQVMRAYRKAMGLPERPAARRRSRIRRKP